MRLSEVLSKESQAEFIQIDDFLGNSYVKYGVNKKIKVGKVFLSLKCNNCEQVHQFYSDEELSFIPVYDSIISIDCRLTCQYCQKISVPVWFLIQIEGVIFSNNKQKFTLSSNPKARIIYKHVKYSSDVEPEPLKYKKEYSDLLLKADQAYSSGLGAGALVYLRKLYEMVTIDTAIDTGISYKDRNGKNLNFREILTRVDAHNKIIPQEFSNDGYKIFGELSEIVHSSCADEETGIKKYTSLRRLIVGVLDNIEQKKKSEEVKEAMKKLSWTT